MAGLSTEERTNIESKLKDLKDPVQILFHKPEGKEGQFDEFITQLDEICTLSELLTQQNMVEMETEEDMIHDVDMFPAIVLIDKDGKDHGIRFYGTPSNKFMEVLIDTILIFSKGEVELEGPILEKVSKLEENKMMVLGTPSVPGFETYMNNLVKMAYTSDNVDCAMIDLIQFTDIAEKYHVLDMPKTISNDELKFTGIYAIDDVLEILEKKIGDAEG
jgi:alkyl hydroperoxide reductase subunit AhpF